MGSTCYHSGICVWIPSVSTSQLLQPPQRTTWQLLLAGGPGHPRDAKAWLTKQHLIFFQRPRTCRRAVNLTHGSSMIGTAAEPYMLSVSDWVLQTFLLMGGMLLLDTSSFVCIMGYIISIPEPCCCRTLCSSAANTFFLAHSKSAKRWDTTLLQPTWVVAQPR